VAAGGEAAEEETESHEGDAVRRRPAIFAFPAQPAGGAAAIGAALNGKNP